MMTASKPSLSKSQKIALGAAQRAYRDPKPSVMWTPECVLRGTLPQTRDALERKGLIESYFTADGRIRYRLTAEGLAFDVS